MKGIDFAAHPELLADARALDAALRPLTARASARLGLCEADVDARIAAFLADRRRRDTDPSGAPEEARPKPTKRAA